MLGKGRQLLVPSSKLRWMDPGWAERQRAVCPHELIFPISHIKVDATFQLCSLEEFRAGSE